ncbi:hypothetical protein NC651_007895 [Populus alba x Populus x berolinensis]|nr:hypothetical protein NC651_007895 [Populus alba x Populus x berolinensis]
MANFTASQLKEIAAGLESSGHQFIWVSIRPIFAEQFYNEKLVTDVLKTGVKEWLRVHGDHVKSEAVEKTITQIMSSGAKKRPGRLLNKVDLLAPISIL